MDLTGFKSTFWLEYLPFARPHHRGGVLVVLYFLIRGWIARRWSKLVAYSSWVGYKGAGLVHSQSGLIDNPM
jgi:hypothetical protein